MGAWRGPTANGLLLNAGGSLRPAAAGLAMTLAIFSAVAAPAEDLASLQAAFLRGDYTGVVREIRQMENQGRPLDDGTLYLWGVCALHLDRLEEGRLALERLMSQYPASPWRAQAQEVLGQGVFYYCVQVGSFSSEQNARRLAGEIKKRGYESEVSEGVLGEKTFYRVRVGRFGSRAEAEGELRRLRQEGFPGRIFP